MAIPTTVDTDTELSAVNSILGAIGQSPVTTLNYENPEIGFIYNILTEVNKDVQNEGWIFNTEYNVEKQPDDTTKYITIPANVLRYDVHGDFHDGSKNIVRRHGRLYDTLADDPKDEFDNNLFDSKFCFNMSKFFLIGSYEKIFPLGHESETNKENRPICAPISIIMSLFFIQNFSSSYSFIIQTLVKAIKSVEFTRILISKSFFVLKITYPSLTKLK